MLHLITGASASGKSAYAESCAVECARVRGAASENDRDTNPDRAGGAPSGSVPRKIYLATMKPDGPEARRRIARHRAMRAEKGFLTVECPKGLEHLSLKDYMPEGDSCGGGETWPVILLECLSNLLANEQFDVGGEDGEILLRIRRGISCLQKQAADLIIVTNEVFSDGVDYDADTTRYLRLLGALNQELAAAADQVTEVVYGIPIGQKNVHQ